MNNIPHPPKKTPKDLEIDMYNTLFLMLNYPLMKSFIGQPLYDQMNIYANNWLIENLDQAGTMFVVQPLINQPKPKPPKNKDKVVKLADFQPPKHK